MVGSTGHGLLSRVRSHTKLRTNSLPEQAAEQQNHPRRRQQSDSACDGTSTSVAAASRSSRTDLEARSHWPPIEWDPLKLNPLVTSQEKPPARLYERDLIRTRSLQTKRSFQGSQTRRPRLHHSDSGFSFDIEGYGGGEFDFARERAKALHIISNVRPREVYVDSKGWPSPVSSVSSDKSWFDFDDDDDDDDDDENDDDDESDDCSSTHDTVDPVTRSDGIWDDAQSPQRRPQVGSPNDPGYYMKRGAWKRRGIFFGEQTEEVYQKQEDAFDIP